MHYAKHDGARIAWRRDGQGPALVLVHGTGGDGESNWAGVLDRFTPDWTVIRPDYAGSGATTGLISVHGLPRSQRSVSDERTRWASIRSSRESRIITRETTGTPARRAAS